MTTFNVGERTIWGPSTMQNEVTKTWAKEMTKDEIKYLVNAYSEAARRVKESGFDGVEIHGGHGYVLNGKMIKGKTFSDLSGSYKLTADESGEYYIYMVNSSSEYVAFKEGSIEK